MKASNTPEKDSHTDEAEAIRADLSTTSVASSNRSTWEAAFEVALREKEAPVLDDADLIQNEWDEEEWEW